jgi:hypothetical protein
MSLGSMRHSAPWFNESIAAGTHPLTQTSTTTSHAAHANTNGQDTSEACRTRHQEGPEEGMASSTSVAIKNHLSRDKVVEIFLARFSVFLSFTLARSLSGARCSVLAHSLAPCLLLHDDMFVCMYKSYKHTHNHVPTQCYVVTYLMIAIASALFLAPSGRCDIKTRHVSRDTLTSEVMSLETH